MREAEDLELEVMQNLLTQMEKLKDPIVQRRVVSWLASRLGQDVLFQDSASQRKPSVSETSELSSFATLGELLSAASPRTDCQRVLLGAAFLQKVRGMESLTSLAINRELTHAGQTVKGIATAVSRLTQGRPALIVQVRKAGRTKQARKTLTVTAEGFRYVGRMVRSSSEQ